MKKKWLLYGLSFLFSLMIFAVPVHAVEDQDENLKVSYTVETTSETEAVIKLSIANISDHVLTDVHLQNHIPDDFEMAESLETTISTLNVNETKDFELNVSLKDDTIIQVVPTNNNNQSTVNPSSTTTSQSTSSQTKTHDDSAAMLFVVGCLLSAGLIFYIVKKKKMKQATSLLLVGLMVLSSVGLVKASEIVHKEIQLQDGIVLNNKDYEFSLDISYQYMVNTQDTDTITRGEWINRLVVAMDYPELDVDLSEPYFNDTDGTIVENTINYAVAYGIIEVSEESFYPDVLATREFVAATTVNALGFIEQEDIVCEDVNDINNAKDAYLAVDLGIIDLIDQHFYPQANATQALADRALEVVHDVLSSEEVSDEPIEDIVYQEGVIVFKEDQVLINDGTITILDNFENVKVGTIFVVENGASYQVTSISQQDDQVIVETVEPEMEDVVESMHVEGTGEANLSEFIPEENVVVDEPMLMSVSEDGVTTPDLGSITFEVKLNDNVSVKGKLSGDLTFQTKCDVSPKWGMPPFNFNNVMLKTVARLNVEAGFYVGTSEGAIDEATMNKVVDAFKNGKRCKGTINLGKIPIQITAGVRVYVEVGLMYSLEGYLKVVCNISSLQAGVQIYNNAPRIINKSIVQLSPELGGQVKIGPELAVVLKTLGYDILDFKTDIGAAGSGSVALRPTGMVCADLSAYLFWDISAMQDSKIGKWLNLGWEYEIFNANNSPLKKTGHYEDGDKVETCTYSNSVINGKVIDAETGEMINNASIKVTRISDGTVVASGSTDTAGMFSMFVPSDTELRVTTSKSGYITFSEDISLESSEIRQLQTRLQVKDGGGIPGIAGGYVTDAETGSAIQGVKINVRENWSNTTGDIIGTYTTDSSGYYYIDDLALGNYTLELSKDNYDTGSLNIVVTGLGNTNQNATLNPLQTSEYELRVVLTWGETPRDVDAHLAGVSLENSRFHIYYADRSYYENGELVGFLDVDDTSSYGPETMTLYKVDPDENYSFYLHDFTNRTSSNSTALSNSGASLAIYVKGEYVRTIYIPTNQGGTLWHAFDYDASDGSINIVNTFSYESHPDDIGLE